MIRHRFFCRSSFLALALSCGVAGNAFAQANTAAPAQQATAPQAQGDIVVTAQRREQRLQDVPINITAMSGEQLNARGVTSTQDLGKISPGVIVSQFGGVPSVLTVNIRGVAQLDYADHQESPNAVYLDGAYISFPGASGIGLFDVARVEILSGPQGTLFGRNATGGLIQIVSEKPSQKTSGYAQAEYGSYNQAHLEAALGGAISNTLSGRVSLYYNRQDSWIHNTLGQGAGGDNTFSGRGQLLWQPSSNFQDLISVYGSRTPRVGAGLYDTFATAPDPNNAGLSTPASGQAYASFCQSLGYAAPPAGAVNCAGYVKGSGRQLQADASPSGYFDRAIYGVTNTATWKLGGVTLNAITNYLHINKYYQEHSDSSPLILFVYNSSQVAHQFSQELRLNGDGPAYRWQLGAYFLDVNGTYGVIGDLTDSFGISGGLAYTQKTTSYSVFGQGEYDILPGLTFTLGGRWTRDKKEFRSSALCDLSAADCIANGYAPTGSRFDGNVANDGWSGKVQLSYKPSTNVLVYGGINRGIKGALIVALTPPAPGTPFSDLVVKPEVLTDYEGGVKTSLFDRHVTFNLNGFYYKYHDYQAFKSLGAVGVLFNAQARMYGGEMQIAAKLPAGFSTAFSAALLHTTVYDVQMPDGSFRDSQAPFAPKFSFNGNLRKDVPTRIGTFFAQGDINYVGARYFSTINAPAVHANAYATGTVVLGYTSPDRLWSVQAKVDNVTDTRYAMIAFDASAIAGFTNVNYGRPRTATIQLRRAL
jgi:iron complex outermembrane recepter protein